jgi:predicted phage terminase large subunit-like protein
VAPRDSGKSTWLFKILPLWAAAYRHRMFIAAFADSGTQATQHLDAFRNETEGNALLREDFPSLCTPQRRASTLAFTGNSAKEYRAKSGFAMVARGIDTAILGMKEGDRRPDLIILDDIEKGESQYSVAQAAKRLRTVQDTILPLRLNATVLLSGTTTMSGSILDDLTRYCTSGGDSDGQEHASWIETDGWRPRYFPALVVDPESGEVRSCWPAKWPAQWLEAERRRNPRSYAKNFENQPVDENGIFFDAATFLYGTALPWSLTLLSVDPAVSKKSTSDWTGLAVVSYSRVQDKFTVRHSSKVRTGSKGLKSRVKALLQEFPDITGVLVEVNQGGDLWTDDGGVFKGLDVPVATVHQKESKEMRAERAAAEFAGGRVLFDGTFPELERQLCAFPNVVHDDDVDALTSALIEVRRRIAVQRRLSAPLVAKRVNYAGLPIGAGCEP